MFRNIFLLNLHALFLGIVDYTVVMEVYSVTEVERCGSFLNFFLKANQQRHKLVICPSPYWFFCLTLCRLSLPFSHSDWEEEQVSSPNILRLIYQGRFLHGNVTLGGEKPPSAHLPLTDGQHKLTAVCCWKVLCCSHPLSWAAEQRHLSALDKPALRRGGRREEIQKKRAVGKVARLALEETSCSTMKRRKRAVKMKLAKWSQCLFPGRAASIVTGFSANFTCDLTAVLVG